MLIVSQKSIPVWQRAITVLSSTVVGFLMILALQWGRPVLIPIALAVLLTFLMNPLVKALHHRGLSRVVSVMIAVSAAGIVVMCLGWFVSKQVTGMLSEMPQYTEKIKTKVKMLKNLATGPTRDRIGHMIEEISDEIYPTPAESHSSSNQSSQDSKHPDVAQEPIVVRQELTGWGHLTGYVGSAVEILGILALSLVLLVFFLIEREDLRDRIVLLAGRAKLALTSKALEDITDRISRYIGMVALINGSFGLVLTIGLFFLGVPYALLWGFIAATLRFIPYLGPWMGAAFPITMSLAMSDGWWQPLGVFVFVAVVELFTNNVVEPLLFGHTIGVSPTALLVSAATWLYLWGPVGLVLSAPFAVCLVVLGKNIPQLSFLYLLLCEKPALDADYSFYQRLMLGDSLEAAAMALRRIKESGPERVYDEMLVPVLNFTRRDVERRYLSLDDQRQVLEGMQVSLTKITEALTALSTEDNELCRLRSNLEGDPAHDCERNAQRARILSCPATDETDQIVLQMLSQFLDPMHWDVEQVALETLTSELQEKIRQSPPDIVIIVSVPPGGLAHCRYLCKRLRNASSDVPILVVRCGQKRFAKRDREQLERAGASFVTWSLLESRDLLKSRLPLLTQKHLSEQSADSAITSKERSEAILTANK